MPLVEDIQIFSLNPDLIVTKEDHMCMRLAKSLEDNLEKKKSESQKPLSGCSGYVIVEGKKQNCNECNGLISFNQYYELCKRNCTCNSE